MSLGKALLQIRRDRKLTQAVVSSRSGVAVSYLSRIENGHLEPTVGTLQRVAAALEVPVARIFEVVERPIGDSVPRCPVSASGECIGELLRNRRGRPARAGAGPPGAARYGPEELRLLRMADYIALHGSPEVREALAVMLEALVERARRGRARNGS